MTKIWSERPIEIAHLLNPAFCSTLLFESITGYKQENGSGMPFATAFLVLPVVLHKPTRDHLPKSIATKLHAWIQDNQKKIIERMEKKGDIKWSDIPIIKSKFSDEKLLEKGYIKIKKEIGIKGKKDRTIIISDGFYTELSGEYKK